MDSILAIDLGMRRTGLAVADGAQRIAFPHRTLHSRTLAEVVDGVCSVIDERQVGTVVLGLPLDMNGREGEGALRSRKFAAALEKRVRLPIVFWDERLSTTFVERELRSAAVSRKRIRAQVDESVAAVLLQSYLDAQECEGFAENCSFVHDPQGASPLGQYEALGEAREQRRRKRRR